MPDLLDQPGDGGRRYTDERFPNLEVRNDGGFVFLVLEDGEPIDEFKAYEKPGQPRTSEPFARRRAQHYFDRMASGQMSAELFDRPDIQPQRRLGVRNDTQAMGVEPEAGPLPRSRIQWNKPAAAPTTPHPKGPLGSPLAPGERFGNPKDLDALIARIKQEPDPAKAAQLKKQALSWMQQESAAQRIVRLLLSL